MRRFGLQWGHGLSLSGVRRRLARPMRSIAYNFPVTSGQSNSIAVCVGVMAFGLLALADPVQAQAPRNLHQIRAVEGDEAEVPASEPGSDASLQRPAGTQAGQPEPPQAAAEAASREAWQQWREQEAIRQEQQRTSQPMGTAAYTERPQTPRPSQKNEAIRRLWRQARTCVWQGRHQCAERAYVTLAQRLAHDPDVVGELGNFYTLMGAYDNAAETYAEAATRLVAQGRGWEAGELVRALEAAGVVPISPVMSALQQAYQAAEQNANQQPQADSWPAQPRNGVSPTITNSR